MCMLAITPARMKSAPPTVSTQPTMLRAFQKRMPTPNSIGMRVMPKLFVPHRFHKEPTTVTWFERRYPPMQAMAQPIRNSPSPPEVPPTSLKERLAMENRDQVTGTGYRKKHVVRSNFSSFLRHTAVPRPVFTQSSCLIGPFGREFPSYGGECEVFTLCSCSVFAGLEFSFSVSETQYASEFN